ncbi:MAG: orotidine-5'-phosphate decarboxylase [Bernardetiaceae bacterium]|jgi:orotidine-5'-phosphate decarboxylase|nr:orotidine-5'-phosphate decarboxylase [Bernardetiaceae bacterium]
MTRADLWRHIQAKRSFLCVGLDPDVTKIPVHLRREPDPIFAFNRQIIDATLPYAVAYKPNLAFYESLGPAGWESLQKTLEYLPPEVFTIADAKRGDIGNTSALYARAFFETLAFDSVTVAPYMGRDSVQPFLGYPGKWVVLLALTSNQGSADFQLLATPGGPLFEQVLATAQTWAGPEQLMFVVGATHPATFARVRELAPEHFLLVPGYGAQGGDLAAVARHGLTAQGGLLVNSSRGILFAGDGPGFAAAAGQAAAAAAAEMAPLLDQFAG